MEGQDGENIDPTLRALRSRGRYQILQLLVVGLGLIGASYQLLGNVFIGRHVTSFQCAAPDNDSSTDTRLLALIRNNSHVTYGECEIIVSKDNFSDESEQHPCVSGYDYGFRRELSFRAEFDLVCDRKLLGGLAQTLVILGQGLGAFVGSALSDRFGRKMVLVLSDVGMLIFGVAAGFSPSYPVLAALKFLLGAFQQAALAVGVTMTLELFPAETRTIIILPMSLLWCLGSCSLVLVAYLLREYSWRYLQFAISSISVSAFYRWWYLDESLRWLVANGRKKAALTVLQRAARINRVDLQHVIKTLEAPATHEDDTQALTTSDQQQKDGRPTDVTFMPLTDTQLLSTLEERQTEKLTLMDIFRHRRLLFNAVVMWMAWFTCALSFFALYLMSARLHGNRFLNFFLTALMGFPPTIFVYLIMNRFGRKLAIRPLFALAGLGLLCSGIFRLYSDNAVLRTLSVVSAMLGMVGAAGMFDAIFFYTPEIFPTNLRTQALGVASLVGRFGGMLAPFMNDLADIAVWAPGALIGSLCFLVVVTMHFLPETKGRELPSTIEDVELWHQGAGKRREGFPSRRKTDVSSSNGP